CGVAGPRAISSTRPAHHLASVVCPGSVALRAQDGPASGAREFWKVTASRIIVVRRRRPGDRPRSIRFYFLLGHSLLDALVTRLTGILARIVDQRPRPAARTRLNRRMTSSFLVMAASAFGRPTAFQRFFCNS